MNEYKNHHVIALIKDGEFIDYKDIPDKEVLDFPDRVESFYVYHDRRMDGVLRRRNLIRVYTADLIVVTNSNKLEHAEYFI